MSLVQHAEYELKKAGLFDEDSDYDGMIGGAVIQLISTFAKQGHSGFSAMYTLDVFNRLAKFEALTPITSDPDEWNEVTSGGASDLWQSRRNPSIFSTDGGKTWYDIEAKDEMIQKTVTQQEAKVQTAKVLKNKGLPIPPDLDGSPE